MLTMAGVRKLEAWKSRKELAGSAYSLSAGTPKGGSPGVPYQSQRSAVSTLAKIAKEALRRGARKFDAFLQIAAEPRQGVPADEAREAKKFGRRVAQLWQPTAIVSLRPQLTTTTNRIKGDHICLQRI
jgi:four helix bundle protein